MRRALIFIVTQFVLLLPIAAALDRQPNADYRTRRQAVAKKTEGGVVLLFVAAPKQIAGVEGAGDVSPVRRT